MRVGRRSLGASNIVTGSAVQEDLGWRKLEERREEMKVLFDKRLEGWMKKLSEDGEIVWWEDYEVLRGESLNWITRVGQ